MPRGRRGQDTGACAKAAPGEEDHDDGALILARSSRWAEGVGEAGDTERSNDHPPEVSIHVALMAGVLGWNAEVRIRVRLGLEVRVIFG